MRTILKAVFVMMAVSEASAQEKTWNLIVAGSDTIYHCRLMHIGRNAVIFRHGVLDSIAVDSIDAVFRSSEGNFWSGAGYGALAGGLAGAAVGALTYQQPPPPSSEGFGFSLDFGVGGAAAIGAIIGSAGGFVIGGLIGASEGGVEGYDLSSRPRAIRVAILRNLIQ